MKNPPINQKYMYGQKLNSRGETQINVRKGEGRKPEMIYTKLILDHQDGVYHNICPNGYHISLSQPPQKLHSKNGNEIRSQLCLSRFNLILSAYIYLLIQMAPPTRTNMLQMSR